MNTAVVLDCFSNMVLVSKTQHFIWFLSIYWYLLKFIGRLPVTCTIPHTRKPERAFPTLNLHDCIIIQQLMDNYLLLHVYSSFSFHLSRDEGQLVKKNKKKTHDNLIHSNVLKLYFQIYFKGHIRLQELFSPPSVVLVWLSELLNKASQKLCRKVCVYVCRNTKPGISMLMI